MNIHNIKLLESLYPANTTQKVTTTDGLLSETSKPENNLSFSDMLTNSINSLDNKQLASNYAMEGLVSGEADNLHNVMITTAEAQISLEMAVQLRNRALEAMNEIKNMQF